MEVNKLSYLILSYLNNRLLFKSGLINNWIWGSIWLVLRTSLPETILLDYRQEFMQSY